LIGTRDFSFLLGGLARGLVSKSGLVLEALSSEGSLHPLRQK